MQSIKVVQYGLGPIGCGTAAAVVDHPNMELVGAVDIDPQKVGKDVGQLLPGGQDIGIKVKSTLAEVLAETEADLAIHSTISPLPKVVGQLKEIAEAGLHVVSTCEELAYPWFRYPEESKLIDSYGKSAGKAIVGTGVNPGFAMDLLPAVINTVILGSSKVEVQRILDAGKRRGPLQAKVGAGMEKEDFMALAREEKNGHAGFIESVALLGAGLGWELDEIYQEILPVMAEKDIVTEHSNIKAGQVAGINQTAWGLIDGKKVITLNLQMYVGAPQSFDKLSISGNPNLEMVFNGGIPGDIGTVASTVNSCIKVMRSQSSGLVAVKDLPASVF